MSFFTGSIKISELDKFPEQLQPEDFFPIVNSSSMTTYRIDAVSMSQVIPPTIYCTGSEYSSQSIWAASSSWASHSLYSDNVAFKGYQGYVPIWWSSSNELTLPLNTLNGPEVPYSTNENTSRGNLKYLSPLYVSASSLGYFVTIEPAYSLAQADYNPVPSLTWYTQSGGFKIDNVKAGAISTTNVGGLFTNYPLVSKDFVGTDRLYYALATSSLDDGNNEYTDVVWSGSAASGSYVTIGTGAGALAAVLNGKWIRVQCIAGDGVVSPNTARGEERSIPAQWGGFGRVKFTISTPDEGSNSNQIIDMYIHNQRYTAKGRDVTVLTSTQYGRDIIKMIRLGGDDTPTDGDPFWFMDLFIDDIDTDDVRFRLLAESWGGIRFLRELNVDPPQLVSTGSTPQSSSYLIIPPEPGYYTTANYPNFVGNSVTRNYNIQGTPVVIWPTQNERTASVRDYSAFTSSVSASLTVEGVIDATDLYACQEKPGVTRTVILYDPSASMWQTCTYTGGILTHVTASVGAIVSGSTNSGSIIIVQSGGGDTLPIGSIVALSYPRSASVIPANWLECDGRAVSQSVYPELWNAIRTSSVAAFGFPCNSAGVYNAAGTYFKLPDLRAEFIRGWDHITTDGRAARGLDSGRNFGTSQTSGIISHTHNLSSTTFYQTWIDNSVGGGNNLNIGAWTAQPVFGFYHQSTYGSAATTTQTGGLTESRPRNIAMIYIIKYSNATNLADLTGTTLAGDVTGATNNTSVGKIQGVPVASTLPTEGQVLTYTGGQWVPTSGISGPGVCKAWAMCACTSSTTYSSLFPGVDYHYWAVICGYNVRGVTGTGNTGVPGKPTAGQVPPIASDNPAVTFIGAGNDRHWLVTLNTTMSSTNYAVFGSCGGQDSSTPYSTFVTMYPRAARTTTQFTLSMAAGSTATFAGGANNIDWINFQVFENPTNEGNPTPPPF